MTTDDPVPDRDGPRAPSARGIRRHPGGGCVVVGNSTEHPSLRRSRNPRFPRRSRSESVVAPAPSGRPGRSARTAIANPAVPCDHGFRPRRLRLALAARMASPIGLSPILPSVPSRRGAEASRVANTACTASTTPTCAKDRRDPVRFPSSTPQNTFNRAFTRSTAVRPLYIRSNSLVARGRAGNRLGSASRHPHRLAVRLARVALRRHRALPPLVLRRAAVLQRLPLRLMADVGHLVSHRRIAHLIIAIDRPVFRIHHVRRAVVPRQHPLGLPLPQAPHLDRGLISSPESSSWTASLSAALS